MSHGEQCQTCCGGGRIACISQNALRRVLERCRMCKGSGRASAEDVQIVEQMNRRVRGLSG